MRYVLGFICALALGLMGCSETSGTGGSAGTSGTGGSAGTSGTGGSAGHGGECGLDAVFDCPCQRPLGDYCEGEDSRFASCPTWAQALATTEKFAVDFGCGCAAPWPFAATAGQCGDFRYVQRDCGDEYIEFFDASGTLVAAYWWTDQCGWVCPGSCSVDYGPVPECELEQELDFCEQND
jgi:hypothetical protein